MVTLRVSELSNINFIRRGMEFSRGLVVPGEENEMGGVDRPGGGRLGPAPGSRESPRRQAVAYHSTELSSQGGAEETRCFCVCP